MSWKRLLRGNVKIVYCRWQRWNTIGFEKYWSGRLLYFNVSKFSFHIDCRIDWLEDMVTGIPE